MFQQKNQVDGDADKRPLIAKVQSKSDSPFSALYYWDNLICAHSPRLSNNKMSTPRADTIDDPSSEFLRRSVR